jgi:hypothetical protein
MALAQLKIIYRSNLHARLGSWRKNPGIWQKNGFKVETSPQLLREKARIAQVWLRSVLDFKSINRIFNKKLSLFNSL